MRRIFLTSILILAATISLGARTTDRGLGNPRSVYTEKGSWLVGLSGSYHRLNAEGLNGATGSTLVGLIDNLSGNALLGSVDATAAWFFADNFAVGARFGYDKKQIDLDDATLLGLLPFQNRHVSMMHLSGALTCRGYLPLFDTRYLALFGEGRLGGKRGYTMNYEITDRGNYGTYADDYSLSMSMHAGISVYLTDFSAVEISMPIIEGGYAWDNQIKGGESESTQSHAYCSFMNGILGISFGITFTF